MSMIVKTLLMHERDSPSRYYANNEHCQKTMRPIRSMFLATGAQSVDESGGGERSGESHEHDPGTEARDRAVSRACSPSSRWQSRLVSEVKQRWAVQWSRKVEGETSGGADEMTLAGCGVWRGM